MEMVERCNAQLAGQMSPLVQRYSELVDKYAAVSEGNGRLKARVAELERVQKGDSQAVVEALVVVSKNRHGLADA